ncbi:hypothetical protein HJG60_008249 [Phyllostomus discolor]|uniref:Uncharacterized protein n=1 Tax=Phyllostomus discolor TaxID=89673 RepID=A0A833Z9B1_9CHIR|nr:hypothetical protein HJG60_008249 [Phyllostomus discolor]
MDAQKFVWKALCTPIAPGRVHTQILRTKAAWPSTYMPTPQPTAVMPGRESSQEDLDPTSKAPVRGARLALRILLARLAECRLGRKKSHSNHPSAYCRRQDQKNRFGHCETNKRGFFYVTF